MPRGYRKKILPHPAKGEEWREHFKKSSMRVGFTINLSKTMLEYLCAVSDGVQWDRSLYPGNVHVPDNWLACQNALLKRGLIECKSDDQFRSQYPAINTDGFPRGEWTWFRLTQAGELVVGLVIMCGLFHEADAGIEKKAR
jgi:hypothetical protein